MIRSHMNKQPSNRLTATFADGSQSFLLPKGATLEHVADRIVDLSARHEQRAVAVVVKFAPAALQCSTPRAATAFRSGLLAELPRLRAFARSMARNPDRADDLVQETLAKAWAHRNKFKEGTNLRAWLFTILRNTYYGELRSRRREVSRQRWTPCRPACQSAAATSLPRAAERCPPLSSVDGRPARSTLPGGSIRHDLRRGGSHRRLCCWHDQEPRLPCEANPSPQVGQLEAEEFLDRGDGA